MEGLASAMAANVVANTDEHAHECVRLDQVVFVERAAAVVHVCTQEPIVGYNHY